MTTESMESHLVVMGASNLAMAFPNVLQELADRATNLPPDGTTCIHAARGCGRSYGLQAGILGFSAPGLSQCGLAEALAREVSGKSVPVAALLTDVGNDIVYGTGVDRIVSWVSEIAGRITDAGGQVGVTSLPLESLARVPPWKFQILRRIFYPFRPVTQADVMRQARELQSTLESLGQTHGWRLLEAPASWYRFDHFHLRRSCRRKAFATWVSQLLQGTGHPLAEPVSAGGPVSLDVSKVALRYHPPAQYRWLGAPRHRPQSGLRVTPQISVSCY